MMLFLQKILFITIMLIMIGCTSVTPVTFVETPDETGSWQAIHLHNNYGFFQNKNQQIWRRAIDILSEKYDLEVIDQVSGYIRTAWKSHLETDDQKYRSRITLKMQGTTWHTAKLKSEAQWWDNSKKAWLTGYDTAILNEIYQDLQGRIGTTIK
jgi:hypothetical protein